MARDWFENHFSEQLQVSNCIRHNLFCMMNWEFFAILHLNISCRIDWFIDFFSPYHHTSTRRISFSKRVPCNKIISSFLKLHLKAVVARLYLLRLKKFLNLMKIDILLKQRIMYVRDHGCSSHRCSSFSLSLFWAPCIIADSQNSENNKIQ